MYPNYKVDYSTEGEFLTRARYISLDNLTVDEKNVCYFLINQNFEEDLALAENDLPVKYDNLAKTMDEYRDTSGLSS